MAKKYDMKVSHNVCSNQYLSSGVADVPKMLRNGITVSLGVDGAASNNAQDMVELMKFTALQHKVATRDPLAMTAEKVLEMATIDGPRSGHGGRDRLPGGRQEGGPGHLRSAGGPKAIPMHNPCPLWSTRLHEEHRGLMVDGKVVMENGVITTVKDEKEIYRKVQKCAEGPVRARPHHQPPRGPQVEPQLRLIGSLYFLSIHPKTSAPEFRSGCFLCSFQNILFLCHS